MGLGILGRSVGDTQYLAKHGAKLIVTDLKTRAELAQSVDLLKPFPNIQFVLGEHRLEDFQDRDLILESAGVPLDSPYIARAKKNGIPVRMSADIFMEIARVPVIGVTGTRGKSTVAHLIYAILQAAGKPVVLGGNVLGISTLSLLSDITSEHCAVLELDSWQCQGLGEAMISPATAVFTTLYKDHLDYYKNDTDAYLSDKSNIFLYQSPDDTLIMGGQCAPTLIEAYGENIVSKIVIADETKLPEDWTLKMRGTHNRYNASIALSAVRVIGIADDISKAVIENFKGVPGRLEHIANVKGVAVYNDTTATTPEATLAALNSFDVAHIVLIMGGSDKKLDMSALTAKLSEVKKVILLSGTGTEHIRADVPDASVYENLSEAYEAARSAASSGDTILFSPAFASFGMFKNEFDRGEQFNALVRTHSI